jgi:hypothetical protein
MDHRLSRLQKSLNTETAICIGFSEDLSAADSEKIPSWSNRFVVLEWPVSRKKDAFGQVSA